MERKTHTKSCKFEIVITGNYSYEVDEEEDITEPIPTDCVWDYVASNISDYYLGAKIKTFDEKIE